MRPDALPPASLLDHDGVREAYDAWRAATTRHESLSRDRINAEQVELPAAVEADKQADVEALERGRKLPVKQAHEQQTRDRITDLERRGRAADTIAAKAHASMLETLTAETAALRERAAERNAAAERRFGEAIAALEAAAGELGECRALRSWTLEPASRAFKRRAVSTPIKSQGGDSLTVDAVLAGLREVIEPPPAPEPAPPQAIPAHLLAERIPD